MWEKPKVNARKRAQRRGKLRRYVTHDDAARDLGTYTPEFGSLFEKKQPGV